MTLVKLLNELRTAKDAGAWDVARQELIKAMEGLSKEQIRQQVIKAHVTDRGQAKWQAVTEDYIMLLSEAFKP